MVVITVVTVVAMILRFLALMYQPGSKRDEGVKRERDEGGMNER